MTPSKIQVNSSNALFTFYDIESLQNAFTLCAFAPRANRIDVFHLVDPGTVEGMDDFSERDLAAAVAAANPAYVDLPGAPRRMFVHDLSTWAGSVVLARMMGLSDADSVNDPDSPSSYGAELRPVCDTDDGYDPVGEHPYLAGCNSYNYDTSMLALFFMESFADVAEAMASGDPSVASAFRPASAARLRGYSDDLFSSDFRDFMPRYLSDGRVAGGMRMNSAPFKIRRAMLHSGRHIDIAMLNEVQRKVGLKRLLGGEGRQILESDKLGSHNARVRTLADLYELLAYNVSDCIGLQWLSRHPIYASAFDLKVGLMQEYPETVYDKSKHSYAPNIHPKAVRRDRLTPDSTSAKFVGKILSPYGHLDDIEGVSFLYPSEAVARERGVERRNVLEDCREFFYASICDQEARSRFDSVYEYYKSIEGQNFNDSREYDETWGLAAHPPRVLKEIPKLPNNVPYFNADGTSSTCFATFSTGGIHGAEADYGVYGEDLSEWVEWQRFMAAVRAVSPDPLIIREAKEMDVPMPDGEVRRVAWSEVITSKTTLKALRERRARLDALGEDPDPALVAEVEADYAGMGFKPGPKKTDLFKPMADGSTKLNPKYTFTSVDAAIHEDFTSYYPNMLRNMSAFYNAELGEDRYAKILADKDRYGREMKAPGLTEDQKARLKVLRNGTKLILNSASGAGDTTHFTPIRVNNQIISMRIIGQLFSWRIGQAQTLAGARIVSTNTDGLYSVLDEATNNRVLAEQAAQINVEIEPEPLVIVSKDSNNRLEMVPGKDGSWSMLTSGGTLACSSGPRPDKALAHPAVVDWALARYLRACTSEHNPDWDLGGVRIDAPFDRKVGMRLMRRAATLPDAVLAARLFQNVLAASVGMVTFPFAADPVDPVDPDLDAITGARPLQHYNRVFFVHPGKPGAVSLRAAGAWIVNPPSRMRRASEGLAPTVTDPVALAICEANGFARDRITAAAENRVLLPVDQDVVVRRIPRIEPSWSALVRNEDLHCLPEAELRDLLGCLDLDVYVGMLAETFEENWMNGPKA